MAKIQLQHIVKQITQALVNNRMSVALSNLQTLADMAGATWQIKDEIKRLSESYGYLQRYALDGIEDPSRATVFAHLKDEASKLMATIVRYADIESSPKQYFNVIRYERLQHDSSISDLIKQYEAGHNRYRLAVMGGVKNPTTVDGQSLVATLEHLQKRLFNLVWVSLPLSSEDEDALNDALESEILPNYFKELLISAIMLGAMQFYDERRLTILGETYVKSNGRLEVKALCALLLTMWMQKNITGHRVKSVIASVCEKSCWQSDLKMIFMQLARTRDTERITRTMNEAIRPIVEMRPDIYKKIGDVSSVDDLTNLDENPDWMDWVEKSGINDKLRKLSDLQAEGGDVMMGTFSHLKSFQFFSDIANWFLPFYLDNSAVQQSLGSSTTEIGELIIANPMLCDSDKYSLVLSLEKMPSDTRRAMLSQFKLQDINFAELQSSELNAEAQSRERISLRYIQDIYRFFMLYRRKGEFISPFAKPINLSTIPLIKDQFNDVSILSAVADFYHKQKYYAEAYELYDAILRQTQPTAQLYQKAGYCQQQLGRADEALALYTKSEMLDSNSLWTARRMAQCYKILGQPDKALIYYQRVEHKKPDDVNVAMNIGHCYLEMSNYEAALKQYYKVDFLDAASEKALRPLAWCTFLTGDYEKSQKYYDRVLNNGGNG